MSTSQNGAEAITEGQEAEEARSKLPPVFLFETTSVGDSAYERLARFREILCRQVSADLGRLDALSWAPLAPRDAEWVKEAALPACKRDLGHVVALLELAEVCLMGINDTLEDAFEIARHLRVVPGAPLIDEQGPNGSHLTE
jgi:hypothetical protein